MTTAEKLKQEGRQEGEQESEQKGLQKGIYQTASNMIKNGMDDDLIQKCTDLSKEEIDKLRKEVK